MSSATRKHHPAPVGYDAILRHLIKNKWTVVSEGPSGAQLEGPKKMKGLDVGAMVLGAAVILFVPVVGIILIGAAVIDYALLTSKATHYLDRATPKMPRG